MPYEELKTWWIRCEECPEFYIHQGTTLRLRKGWNEGKYLDDTGLGWRPVILCEVCSKKYPESVVSEEK